MNSSLARLFHPSSDVNVPLYILKSLSYRLRGKTVNADWNTRIRGLQNLTVNGTLSIGRAGGFLHRHDHTHIDLRGNLTCNGGVTIGKGTRIEVGPGASCLLDSCHLTGLITILARRRVEIGKGCVIAWNVQIMDWDSHKIDYPGKRNKVAEVIIGDQVWIGAGAMILQGVHIGKGSVIAAGSVVTKSIPAGVLAGGNPARVIKEGVTWGNYEEEQPPL